MSHKKLETYDELSQMIGGFGQESQEVMSSFMQLRANVSKDGALKNKYKELIALGISIDAQCEGCITMHIQDAIEAGATHQEIVETIGVAIYMGGGPKVIYGSKAFAALKEYEEAHK